MKKQKAISANLRKIMLNKFQFLIDEYDCKLIEQVDDSLFYQLTYKNSTTGVIVTYDAREQYIDIDLYRLVNGQIIKNLMHALKGNETINGFSLDYIVKKKTLRDTTQILSIHEYGKDADFTSPEGFSKYLDLFTTNLKKYAGHILKGDFTDFKHLDVEFRRDYHQNINTWDKG